VTRAVTRNSASHHNNSNAESSSTSPTQTSTRQGSGRQLRQPPSATPPPRGMRSYGHTAPGGVKSECAKCGANSTPLWRRGLNDELNCNVRHFRPADFLPNCTSALDPRLSAIIPAKAVVEPPVGEAIVIPRGLNPQPIQPQPKWSNATIVTPLRLRCGGKMRKEGLCVTPVDSI